MQESHIAALVALGLYVILFFVLCESAEFRKPRVASIVFGKVLATFLFAMLFILDALRPDSVWLLLLASGFYAATMYVLGRYQRKCRSQE